MTIPVVPLPGQVGFFHPSAPTPLWLGQKRFAEAVWKLAPEVPRDLAQFIPILVEANCAKRLDEWRSCYHLPAWMGEIARQTLRFYRALGGVVDDDYYRNRGGLGFPILPTRVFREPLILSEQEESADRKLKEGKRRSSKADLIAELQGAGWKRVTDKRSPHHFAWLVEYQVLERSYPQIHESAKQAGHHITKDGIQLAVRDTARAIQLEPLRASPRGRPRSAH